MKWKLLGFFVSGSEDVVVVRMVVWRSWFYFYMVVFYSKVIIVG